MIKKGANKYDWALHWACMRGHINIINLLIDKGVNNFNKGFIGACNGGQSDAINLMISKGALIDYNYMKKFNISNLLYTIMYSSKIHHGDTNISINTALSLILNEYPHKKIEELIEDFQKEHIWKPSSERHLVFPEEIKNRIKIFMTSINFYSNEQLKQKIPKPLLWMIINLFIKNNK